jgi:hypothetical protein
MIAARSAADPRRSASLRAWVSVTPGPASEAPSRVTNRSLSSIPIGRLARDLPNVEDIQSGLRTRSGRHPMEGP